MKTHLKIFTFGHCRSMLARLSPHSTKDIEFLDCTVCTDSGESRKPLQASYSWQSRNYDATIQRFIKANLYSSIGKAARRCTSTRKVVGSGNYAHQQEIKVTFTTSDLKPTRNTFSETTQGLKCGLSLPFINSQWGKIEGGQTSLPQLTISSLCRV